MDIRIIYNTQEVLNIDENEGVIYTSDNIIIGDLKKVKETLDRVGVDTTKLNDFVYTDASNHVYYILPIEIVGRINQYSGYVMKTYRELIFDVTLASEEIVIEQTTITIPRNQIRMLPCSSRYFADDAVQLLDAIIELWNYDNPTKQVNFQYKFNSYAELMAFINAV